MKPSDAEPLIRDEWRKQPEDQRTENDVLAFHGELSENRPGLLSFRCSGDKYQHLKTILRGLITE